MQMKFFKFPIITLTTSFVLGIVLQHFVQFRLKSLFLALIVFFTLFIFVFLRARKKWFQDIFFGIISYLLMANLGALSLYFHTDIHYENHYSKYLEEDENTIVGTITTILKPTNSFQKYILEVTECNRKPVFGKILFFEAKSNANLTIGDKITFNKDILPTLKATNPSQFDYSKYLEKQNIHHQVFCKANDVILLGKVENWNYYLQEIRDKLSQSFDGHHFKHETKSILDALLFGQRNFIDKETITNFSKSGVVHILAISGLHIGILYVFLAFVLKPLYRFKNGKVLRLVLILVLLWMFAFVTGLPASVTRAVTLFSFITLGNYFNQQTNIFNAVAVSALLLLLFHPNFIFDVGFQLSYAAVIAILLFQPYFETFYVTKNRVGVYFTDIILVSLAAQIGVLPLSLYYFHQLPLLFLLANLVVIPIASFVLIIGSITLILNFVFKPFAILLGKLLTYVIDLMFYYIRFIAQIEGGLVEHFSFTPLIVLVFYGTLFSFIYWLYKMKWFAFRNAMICLMLLQIVFIYTYWNTNTTKELIVFNSKKTLISVKDGPYLQFYSNEVIENNLVAIDYVRDSHGECLKTVPIQNVLEYKGKKIILIDSLAVYDINVIPDIVLLSDGPKINLQRLIATLHPKEIVADNSNPFYLVNQWKATCEQEKIPFHATAEKGFYKLQ